MVVRANHSRVIYSRVIYSLVHPFATANSATRFSMTNKHSQAALIRLLESGIREVGDLDKDRFFIIVQNVVASGSPPDKIIASVSVRFLPGGAPYCCGEPGCYSRVFRDDGLEELGDFVRREMNLKQTVSVELNVYTKYYNGIRFSAHHDG